MTDKINWPGVAAPTEDDIKAFMSYFDVYIQLYFRKNVILGF